jgi:hypothetical protein
MGVPPALAGVGTVLLTGLLARELGGEGSPRSSPRWPWPSRPSAAHLAGPSIYDFLAWAALSFLVVRILRTGGDRLWVLVGLLAGVTLLDKETILSLLASLVVGLLLTGDGVLRSPWPWAGTVIAGAIWLPNLLWQAHHSWPIFEMSRNLRREHSGLGPALKFVPAQLGIPGWYVAPVWLAGLVALLREDRFRPHRAFAVAYGVSFVAVLTLIPDRPYYFAGLYPVLLAVGAVVTTNVVPGARRFFSARSAKRTRPRRDARSWR